LESNPVVSQVCSDKVRSIEKPNLKNNNAGGEQLLANIKLVLCNANIAKEVVGQRICTVSCKPIEADGSGIVISFTYLNGLIAVRKSLVLKVAQSKSRLCVIMLAWHRCGTK
jgi:hypothetical protein